MNRSRYRRPLEADHKPPAKKKPPRVPGANLGKWHGKRKVPRATGAVRIVNGKPASPVLAASYDPVDVRCAIWWAQKRGIPLAQVLRDALFAYLFAIRADVPPSFNPEGNHAKR